MIVIPENNRIMVFKSGISIGLNGFIFFGGHDSPISISILVVRCENIQKNDKKNITSDIMNIIIPNFMLLITLFECVPWNDASRVISRHH